MNADVSNQPATPPTDPGELGTARQVSAWPSILGMLAIVLGVLGAIGAVWGLAAPRLFEAYISENPEVWAKAMGPASTVGQAPNSLAAIPPQFSTGGAWMTISFLLTFGLGVGLFVCGIGFRRRRRWSLTSSFVWAILKILFVIVSVGATWLTWQSPLPIAGQQGFPMGNGFVEFFTMVGFGLGLLWGCALPVFVLVWFSRVKIKEEVAVWL